MNNRLSLHTILKSIVDNVYFQPPESLKLNYPCIVYERSSGDSQFADNHPYIHTTRYKITVIDADPDSEIPGKVARLPMCTMDMHFTKDNFNHDVFNIYY